MHLLTQGKHRWIGVDLNTTGYAVVVADPTEGDIMKLGKRLQYARTATTKNCTKFYREGKLWKLKRIKSREKKEFLSAVHKIARQIVSFAEHHGAGIRFEKLFPHSMRHGKGNRDSVEFSFENGSFVTLLNLVEKRAKNHGIPVQYVNPSNTSKKCSHCGAFGRRARKRFECLQCGRVIHADVNAALNIAAACGLEDKADRARERISRKSMRKRMRAELTGSLPGTPGIPALPAPLQEMILFPDQQAVEGNAG